jgi:hypothetical protein
MRNNIRRELAGNILPRKKIWTVLAGLRGEDSIARLCRKKDINQNLSYYC